jgi:dipeptidyl-peptidase 4
MTHPRRTVAVLAAAVVGAVSFAQPGAAQERHQLTTTDYQRAERFLGWHSSSLISGDEVNPRFLPDGNRFWYRNKIAAGHEFVLVDPVANARRPVFDHARLAAAMSIAADTAFEGHKLPFQSFEFKDSERAIEFDARRRRFHCTITDYSCSVGDTLPNTNPYVASPDSSVEVFYRDYNLWIRPFGGGDSTQLTMDGEKYNSYGATEPNPTTQMRRERQPPRPQVVWSPDSRKLIVMRRDERDVEHHHYVSYTSTRPRHFSQPYALPGDSIVPVPNVHIIDIASKRNIPLRLDPVPNQLALRGSPRDSTWAPDSRTVRLSYLTRASKGMYLVEADAETGAWRFLAADSARTWVETNPQGGPSWALTADGQSVIWWSERDGWAHLYRFDGRKGEDFTVTTTQQDGDGNGDSAAASEMLGARTINAAATRMVNQITSGAWFVKRVEHVDESARLIYFTAHGREEGRIPYYAHLYRVNFDGSGLTLLTPEDANHEVSFSPSGRFIVDTYSRIDAPPVTVLRSARDGRVIRTLEEANISRIEEMGWKPGEVFTVKARDGVTDLYGVIYFPTNHDPSKKYPVVEYIYPGPQVGSVRPWGFSVGGENRSMAELGFIVVTLDHLGTPMRSKAFHDNYYGNFIDNGLPDHITGLKQLAARYPSMDLDRVGIWGHSGGGFASTDAVLRFPEFYKVAVSGAGNHDNRSYNIYWAEKYQGLMEKDTVRRTDNYEASANKTYAKNLQGKLLLMHGDMDDNVHPAMTIQLVDELIKANKDFDLVIAPDRAHGLNEPYFIRRRWDYFVRHLMGAEPPANYEIQRGEGN